MLIIIILFEQVYKIRVKENKMLNKRKKKKLKKKRTFFFFFKKTPKEENIHKNVLTLFYFQLS